MGVLDSTEALPEKLLELYTVQYYSAICRPTEHTVGRLQVEIRTRAGRPRGRDTAPRPPHLLYGTDPVHLLQAGYNAIDGRLADKFVSMEE